MNELRELRAEQKPVVTERSGDVLTITLNRPDSGNSLSTGVIAELQLIFDQSADDKSLHVIVLAARGRIFCAGHDLRELRADSSPEFTKRLASVCNRMMQTILRLPQPVIASVQGVATAAGCQLVATCDLAVASTEARFATPGVNIGTWCSTPMVALSRAVHRKHAMQLLLTGRLHDAETALRMGLVNEVVAPDGAGQRHRPTGVRDREQVALRDRAGQERVLPSDRARHRRRLRVRERTGNAKFHCA